MRLVLTYLGVLVMIAVMRAGFYPSHEVSVTSDVLLCDQVVAHRDSQTAEVYLTFLEPPQTRISYDQALTDRIRHLYHDEVVTVTYRRHRQGQIAHGDTTWVRPASYEIVALECVRPLP